MAPQNGMIKYGKWCFFALNFCLVIFSFVGFGIGLIYRRMFEIVDALFKINLTYLSSPVIVAGIFLFVFAMLGCYGAVLENRLMIITFSVLMAIVVVVQVVYIVTTLIETSKDKLKDSKVKQYLNDSMNEYDRDEKVQTAWDFLQKIFKCCGVDNYTDWGEKIPKSCCKEKIEDDKECSAGNFFTEGCWKKLSGSSGGEGTIIVLHVSISLFFNANYKKIDT